MEYCIAVVKFWGGVKKETEPMAKPIMVEWLKKYIKDPNTCDVFICNENGETISKVENVSELVGNTYEKGGDIGSENMGMVLNNNKQIAHHTKELEEAIKGKKVPAWVVAKVNRAASDLSDATHYLDGTEEKMVKGGGVDKGIDLFEDYENIPKNVQKVLDKHEDAFVDGDYKGLLQAHKELESIGYTFEYYLDGQAYDLRPIGTKGKSEFYAKGGGVDGVTKLIPIYTKRDKKGYRFYVDSKDSNKLYAEKNGTLYKVNEDLNPSIPVVRAYEKQDEKFSGILPEEHFKGLEPLHYEKMGINKIAKSFNIVEKMKNGGGVGSKVHKLLNGKKEYIQKKVKKVVKEFNVGKLKTSAGKKVEDIKQALAIGYSEAKKGWSHKRKK